MRAAGHLWLTHRKIGLHFEAPLNPQTKTHSRPAARGRSWLRPPCGCARQFWESEFVADAPHLSRPGAVPARRSRGGRQWSSAGGGAAAAGGRLSANRGDERAEASWVAEVAGEIIFHGEDLLQTLHQFGFGFFHGAIMDESKFRFHQSARRQNSAFRVRGAGQRS